MIENTPQHINQHQDQDNTRKWYKVFFYGTTMRGFEGCRLLFEKADLPPIYRGECQTIKRFEMSVDDKVAFVSNNKETSTIIGELWEMDSRVLAQMDMLQGHPTWYEREVVKLTNGESAYMYVNNRSEGNLIVSDGNYKRYRVELKQSTKKN